jgi:hypothetical protein
VKAGATIVQAKADFGMADALTAADKGMQAGNDFIESKRFTQIVISTGIKAGQPVGKGIACGKNQYRCIDTSITSMTEYVHTVCFC